LPVCVEGSTSHSHCRSLKRQLAQRVPFTNFRSELSVQSLRHLETQNHGPGFYFVPAANPGRFGRRTGPPRRPRQAPRAETPSGPKSHSGATPRGGWCAPIAALLGHIYPIPYSISHRQHPGGRSSLVAGGPRRPPRGGLGPLGPPRSKTSGPWGLGPPSETSAIDIRPVWYWRCVLCVVCRSCAAHASIRHPSGIIGMRHPSPSCRNRGPGTGQ
jgi:hypothetical protein